MKILKSIKYHSVENKCLLIGINQNVPCLTSSLAGGPRLVTRRVGAFAEFKQADGSWTVEAKAKHRVVHQIIEVNERGDTVLVDPPKKKPRRWKTIRDLPNGVEVWTPRRATLIRFDDLVLGLVPLAQDWCATEYIETGRIGVPEWEEVPPVDKSADG